MLDSIYHMALKLLKSRIFWRETVNIFSSFTQRYIGRYYITLLICKSQVVYRFYCMTLY